VADGGLTIENGKLIVATNAAFPPFEYWLDDTMVGIDIDIAKELANRLGLSLELRNMEFTDVVPNVANGYADIAIAGFVPTAERWEQVNFVQSYYVNNQVILVPPDSPIHNVDDLFDSRYSYTVGAVENTTAGIYASSDLGYDRVCLYYSTEELMEIIRRSAGLLDVKINADGTRQLARRSRGTPRLANRLLKRVRDFALVRYDGVITDEVATDALDLLDVDQYGLEMLDRRILTTMLERFGGGPVGLETLSATIGEDSGTIEDVYEPYLLKIGFLVRTPRGRMVTRAACGHLGYPVPEGL
jgi:hypothetical protein